MPSLILVFLKKKLKRLVVKVAPFTHFIPGPLRHRVSALMLRAAAPWKFRPPLPYHPGLFPGGVNLFGFFKAENGLAQGTRLYASALEASGIPCCFLNTNFLDWLPQEDTSYDSKLTKSPQYSINLIHINPDQWEEACQCFSPENFDHHYNIGVWLWELETIPNEWCNCFANVNEIWAPSQFIANALQKASPVPVTVIPYGISVPCNHELTRTDFNLPEDRFLVLTMYDSNSYSSRKNPGAAIKAYSEAFSNQNAKTTLVIKINHPKEEDLEFIRQAIGDNDYILITERFEKNKLNALIKLCDVFISLHRSEGYGLVMAEAMALHTPVVATNWSANTEFMDPDACCMVDYSLLPVNDDYQFGQSEHRWADADIHHAASYLLQLYTDPTFYRHKAEAGYQKISTQFSINTCATLMKQRIDEILSHKYCKEDTNT